MSAKAKLRLVAAAATLAALLSATASSRAHAQAPPCTCRLPQDRSAELGRSACLRASDGAWRVAWCVMALNNTSWRFTDEACAPVSRRQENAPDFAPASKMLRLSAALF